MTLQYFKPRASRVSDDKRCFKDFHILLDGSSGAFVLNGIEHANRIIGQRVFNPAHWIYVGKYNEQGRVWQAGLETSRSG